MSNQVTTIQVTARPFQVPNFVTVDLSAKAVGDKNQATLPISDLDRSALDTLARQWLDELYKKAGCRCPFEIVER